MLYEASKLTKVYGRSTVLNIPSLEIEQGCIYALLGPNGAGKTTLLNILGFLDNPTSGSLRFKSKPVRYTALELRNLRKAVVMVDQHPILFTTTVYKNLDFGLKIRGRSKKERGRIIDETLELVGMRSFAGERAHLLSGGETQRIALARALALSPEVFLCDEPTSSVDVEHQQIILNTLRQINEEKKINVIFTTHDRSQASLLAHQIMVLDRGRLIPAAYENIFSGVMEQVDASCLRFVVRNGFVLDVPVNTVRGDSDSTKVFIDPEKIEILRVEEDKWPLNTVSGKIVSVATENGKIRLVVDAGVLITMFISAHDYRAKKIMAGDTVGLIISPESVHIM